MRKKFLILLTLLFVAWMAISLYFYCQHYLVVKSYPIDKKIVFQDVTVWIREISIEDYSPNKKQEELMKSYRGPWYFKYVQKLPQSLRMPFLKACYFYSSPYDFNNKFGTLRLKGLILLNAGTSPHPENQDILKLVGIYIYDEDKRYYGSGFGITGEDNSNFCLFDASGKNAPYSNKVYTIIVEDERTKDERSFVISPEWSLKTTTFFDLGQEEYQFSPLNLINRFSSLMWQGKKEEIGKYLLPGAAGQQVWSTLNHRYWKLVRREYVSFVGSHAGFDYVFSLNITFGQQKPDHSGTLGGPIPVASQNIYFIDNGGKPLIVGADPLKKY